MRIFRRYAVDAVVAVGMLTLITTAVGITARAQVRLKDASLGPAQMTATVSTPALIAGVGSLLGPVRK